MVTIKLLKQGKIGCDKTHRGKILGLDTISSG
jgi:hypothetical protein